MWLCSRDFIRRYASSISEEKQESDVVQLSLSCVEVNPLIQRNSNGAIPIPENSNRIHEGKTPKSKQKFNFNGAKEVWKKK